MTTVADRRSPLTYSGVSLREAMRDAVVAGVDPQVVLDQVPKSAAEFWRRMEARGRG